MTDQATEYLVKRQQFLIVDTCCLLCLHVSGHMREILSVTAARVMVPQYIQHEELLNVDLGPYIKDRTLEIAIPDDLIYTSVAADFASQGLDNGEAFVGAFAKRYSWAVATDDRPAARIFAKDLPHLELVDTPAMLKHWAEQHHPPDVLLRATLNVVQEKGPYRPRRKHPLYNWWEGTLTLKESTS